MDIEKLIEQLNNLEACAYGYHINGEVLGIDCSDFEQIMVDAAEEISKIPTLQAELEQVKRERDAAQSLLAERIGVRGAEPITTAFGLPLDRLRELAQADQEGKIPKYTIGDTIYDRFGDAWEVTVVERHLLAGEPKWIYRCGHIGTNDYCALWEFEVLTRAEAEAALQGEREEKQ